MIGTNAVLNERYRLVSVLATGGMGVIWRGWDKRSQSVVAVKVLKEELIGNETFLARLRAEAQNASRLRHANLAAVFDWGETEGQGWIVMELVEGRPLSDLLAGGHRLDWNQLAPLLTQVASGLQACHQAHVVHRDVKPSNILVSDKWVAKLTDFGISLAPRAEALTAAGMVMGTAQYLPPEQAMGETATPAGDIYALGIIAYEALAGKRPFTGATQVDIAMAHVKEPVPPLPEQVPAPVATLIYQMLEKDPRLRPKSCAELVQLIGCLWQGELPAAYTPRMAFTRQAAPEPLPTQEMAASQPKAIPDASSKGLAGKIPVAPGSPDTTARQNTRHTPPVGQGSSRPYRQAAPTDKAAPVAAPPADAAPQTPVSPPAAVAISGTSIASHRRNAVLQRLNSPTEQLQNTQARNKIIAGIIITALVLVALAIGLVRTAGQDTTSSPHQPVCEEVAVKHISTSHYSGENTQEEHLDAVI